MLQVRSDMSIYASLGLPPNVVLVTRLGGGYTRATLNSSRRFRLAAPRTCAATATTVSPATECFTITWSSA